MLTNQVQRCKLMKQVFKLEERMRLQSRTGMQDQVVLSCRIVLLGHKPDQYIHTVSGSVQLLL